MKRRFAITLAALLATFALVIGVTTGVAHAAGPGGTLVYKSNVAIFDDANQVAYAVNDPFASLTNGELMQNWARSTQGEPNNDFHGWRIGYVTCSGAGWPWSNTLIEHGTGHTYCSLYSGKWVVMMDFAPYDSDTNYCLAEDVTNSDGRGTVVGWTCQQSALDQLWVSNGIGGYINVRGDIDLSNFGNVGDVAMEGEFTNGGTVGVEPYISTYVHQEYHWYPRF